MRLCRGDTSQPVYLVSALGSRRARQGQQENTPPTASCLSPTRRTREALWWMSRTVES